jgi:hypothetical protein
MAGAGFLFTPHEPGDDTAKCFYCGIELSGWDPNDDPVYVLLALPITPMLTLPARNTGGGLQNVAQNAPFSAQESRNSLIRRRASAKLRLKRLYNLRSLLELAPLKPLIRNSTRRTKRRTLGGVHVLGRPRQRRPQLEMLPLPNPELHPRLPRQMSLVGAT